MFLHCDEQTHGPVEHGPFVAVGAARSIAPAYADPAYDQTDAIRTAELCCLVFSRQGFDVEGRIQPHEGGLDGVADPWG
jgi:hypothetical protein